jgi:hypothetical protein
MSDDPLGKITEGKDLLGKIRNFLAEYVGYVDRENRREADKLLRETIVRRYDQQWTRISDLQKQFIEAGKLENVDELEGAALKLRTFIDRVNGAAYGYAPFFDAVRIHSEELDRIYQYDAALLEGVDTIARAIDNVQASMETEGLPASISHLTSVSQDVIDAFNRREEVILETSS